jgi:hypothetical protein
MTGRTLAVTVILSALALMPERPRAAQRVADPMLADVLAAAGRYVANYESSFGVVVAEERYQQSTNGPATTANRAPNGASRRMTLGDVLLFNSGGAGWMAFRDVRVVDNAPIGAENSRLPDLATNPSRERLADAMRTTEASAKYAIGAIPRGPAIPTAALADLRASRQMFFRFDLEGMKTIDGVRVAVIKFTQRPHARTTDADDFAVTGRFWIEPDSGRVVQTHITIASEAYENNVEVLYASRPGVPLWVPIRMFESYTVALEGIGGVGGRVGAGSTQAYVDGLSTYSGFQRFDLKPALIIK